MTRTIGVAISLALALAMTAGAADAATLSVSVDASGVTSYAFTTAPGETTNVIVDPETTGISFDDSGGAPITSLECVPASASHVDCPLPLGAAKLNVVLGDGNDTFLVQGFHDEVFSGSSVFDGGAGDDAINATPGPDQISGGDGKDSIGAQEGDDTIDGGAGDDWLSGGEGNDTLVGGPGRDVLAGYEGDDTIDARDRPAGTTPDVPNQVDPYADEVRCMDGTDTAHLDLSDLDVAGCETVDKPAYPTPSAGPSTPTGTQPAPSPAPAPTVAPPSMPVASKGSSALKLKKGAVSVNVDCLAGGGDCTGSLRLLSGKTVVATGKFALDNGDKKKAIKLKLSSAGKKLARKKKTLKLSLVAVVAGKQTKLGRITLKTTL